MFNQMIRIEQQKLTRRAMFWVELGLMAAVILMVILFTFFVKQMLDSGVSESGAFRVEGMDGAQAQALLTWPMSFLQILSVAGSWGSFLLIVLSGALTAQEYGWRSFQLWLSRGVPRWSVMVAKFTAVTLAAVLLVGTAVLLGGLLTGILSAVYLPEIPFTAVNWGYLALSVLAVTYSLLPYAALAMLLAVASRSTALTIGGGLAFVTLVEPLAMQLLPMLGDGGAALVRYFPAAVAQVANNHFITQIVNDTASASATTTGPMMPIAAVLLLGVYTVAALGTAVALFQRQELGG
ncbi:MAG: ABC transporter permease subunit [Anaerolineae bacterium]|nr:ABC transporter permease subunit [Anaerolineae bacterium]